LKSFDTLVAGVAHDFNNLLTVISVNNEMILGDGDKLSRQFAENSTEAIKAAIELCSEMSAFSDKSPASLVAVDVVEAVRTMDDTLAQSIPDNVKYVSDLAEESLYSLADIRQLQRALLNLVLNAGEVARSKVIVRVLELELTDDDLINARFVGELPIAGTFHCIEVADDGTGLDDDVLNRMFAALVWPSC
jgi:signal transduction histidine kinase